LAVSALPALAGLGGTTYRIVAIALGVPYFVLGICGLSPNAGSKWARSFFFASMPYLLGLFFALVVGS
jgi:heme O synthase-like polyprenyltransferase